MGFDDMADLSMQQQGFSKQSDINKLLAGRVIIDTHRNRDTTNETDEQHIQSLAEMLAGLNALGFGELNDFAIYNNFMNLCGWLEYRPMIGECDGCPDLQEDDVPCIKIADSLGVDRNKTCYYKINPDYYGAVMVRLKLNIQPDENGRSYLCPKRYIDYTRPEPFDLNWKIWG
jgi:hypothetical protein